jgi:hypothetical protein
MIEETILKYLKGKLSVPVVMEEPEVPSEDYPTPPTQYVLIEKVGGGRTNHINKTSVALQSYGDSLYDAAALDEKVRTAMDSIVELDIIGSAKLASNYNHTDTRKKKYRYQSVYDLMHY